MKYTEAPPAIELDELVKVQLTELFRRVHYLNELNERNGQDDFRDKEIASVEWALVELSGLYPNESAAAQAKATQLAAKRAARVAGVR